MIRLSFVMPRWLLRLALWGGLAIVLEVDGERLQPRDVVQHGRALTLVYAAPAHRDREEAG